MHKELKRYSSIGNKQGIILLCNKVLTKSKVAIDSVRTSCSFVNGCELNLKCGILALEALNLISKDSTHYYIERPFFFELPLEQAVSALCERCFSFLIDEQLVNIELLKFNDKVDLFYIPKRSFSLQSSIFRNLLITFNALVPVNDEFRISKEYDSFFGELVKRRMKKITLEQLQHRLEEEQDMGEQGEIFVLNFEQERCDFTDVDKSRIRQISHIDVSAGYDIISFHDEIGLKRRYIEVKTYKGCPHFYWSANEIESSRLRGDNYFLYLVNFDKINDSAYRPEIIQNPYVAIRDSEFWKLTPSSYLVEKI